VFAPTNINRAKTEGFLLNILATSWQENKFDPITEYLCCFHLAGFNQLTKDEQQWQPHNSCEQTEDELEFVALKICVVWAGNTQPKKVYRN